MAPDQWVVNQPLGGDEPASAFLPIDQSLVLQLPKGLAQSDPCSREHFTHLPLAGQLATAGQQTTIYLLSQGLVDDRQWPGRLIAHN
ncbi:hypothetical protein D3C78_1500030 [compost metagenome]